MKMQKSTMILSGVLGVVSVGSVLMFANPGMQEALVSNIFDSRMYSTPTKPATSATINKNPWGVTPSKPSISGEVVITPSKGKYEGYMNGRLFISTENITKEAAYSNCTQNSSNNTKSSIRCTWNSVEIFSRGATPTPSISGEVILRPTTSTTPVTPKPTTPANTGSTATVEGGLVITVDGKNRSGFYNTSKFGESYANIYCIEYAKLIPTSSKFSCIWNGNKEMSKGYGTQVVATKPIPTPVTPKPTTPANTGSTTNNSGTISLGTLIINTNFSIDKSARYNIAEIEAKAVCESTWKKYENDPKSTQLTCIWNWKTIFSKTKPTSTSTGSTSTGTVVMPNTPVSTGSTSTGVTNSGATTSLGKMDMWVNNQAWNPEYNISQSGALTRCTNYLPSIPTSSVVLCKWNDTTIYSGPGKQVITQTNSGSISTSRTSSGSTSTGSIK